ncbi:MAG: hypothetical protein ABIY55_22560 [Kofleriaceae bacterium]
MTSTSPLYVAPRLRAQLGGERYALVRRLVAQLRFSEAAKQLTIDGLS